MRVFITTVAATLVFSQISRAQSGGGAGSGGASSGGGAGASSSVTSPTSPNNPATSALGNNAGSQPSATMTQQPNGIPAQTRGVNSAGTANSSGPGAGGSTAGPASQTPGVKFAEAGARSNGTTVGRSGVDVTGPNKPGGAADVTADPLQREVDKKMNGICRGC